MDEAARELVREATHEAVREVVRETVHDAAHAAAKEAAREVVRETLTALGIDLREPTEVQADFQAVRNWRLAQRQVRKMAIGTAVSIVVSGIAAMVWLGLKSKLGS